MERERPGRRAAAVSPARVHHPAVRASSGGKAIGATSLGRPAPAASRRSSIQVQRAAGMWLRRRIGFWLLAKAAAVGILVAGLSIATQVGNSRQFQVAEVVIAGNELVGAEDIAAAIHVGGTNTFAVRGRRLERMLRGDPAIESISIKPRLPNTVEVLVTERAPSVVWEASGRTLLTDATGLALREGTREDLPVVHAPEGPTPDPGGRVDVETVRMAAALVPRFDVEGLTGGQLEYRPAYGATVILPNSARLAIGNSDDLEDKLAAYRAIRGHLDQNRAKAELIDVRFLERPYFR